VKGERRKVKGESWSVAETPTEQSERRGRSERSLTTGRRKSRESGGDSAKRKRGKETYEIRIYAAGYKSTG